MYRATAPAKDPDEKKDYGFDWSAWLGVDTIASSVWLIDGAAAAGVIAPSVIQASPAPSNNTTTTTIWLSGGTNNADYSLLNRITTAAGRICEASFSLPVRSTP